jgi:SAM-dependent methyltransferase
MKGFEPYLDFLESLVNQSATSARTEDLLAKVDASLDGQPAAELRRLVPLVDIRESGAFFTGSELSRAALEPLTGTLDDSSVILDPACGAGDLLIACARRLSKGKEDAHTLDRWGTQLIGRDLHPQFIRATKLRLALAAMREGALHSDQDVPDIYARLPGIEQRSGLTDSEAIERATHIVVNPPFTQVDAPAQCGWASGKVNSAALFLEACVAHARPGTRIVAILPDVLRSGSRYRRWRRMITERSLITRLELYGQFDKWADVDVFVVELEMAEGDGCSISRWGQPIASGTARIKDYCNVSVGPVVNYRDPHRGPWRPFIQSRDLSAWQSLERVSARRRFEGRVLKPPFVVVRRTSRVGDRHRAIGTIIGGDELVAVENHLLVLMPKDRTIETCRRVLSRLNNAETTHWLDQRIRCRHLTVSSIEELPWWST